jgi:hypothetical protein
MEWIAVLTGLYLLGGKIQDGYSYVAQVKNAHRNHNLRYRSHLDEWQRYDFDANGQNNDEAGYVDEFYQKKDLDEMGIALGDIDTYRGTHYLLEDDEIHNLNATQGIRITTPALYQFA